MRAVFVLLALALYAHGQYQWQTRDALDEVREKMLRVTADNCMIKLQSELFLDDDTVSHLPDIKELEVNPIFPNRTALLNLHNMAMNRAFFFSFILQKAPDEAEPGFMYYFLSTIADVAGNSKINASAIYFAPNSSYTPSYRGFFNKTMPLFAPRAFRADDFNLPFRLQRESTLNTIDAIDLGVFRKDSFSLNYTHQEYRINEWYNHWLPDLTTRQDSKATYYVTITYGNSTNETFVWHGPPGGDEIPGPVKWTRPYFDCGRSNKWIVGATVPIPDIYPRHTQFRHTEYPRYGAVAVLEMDFERVDINQCPRGRGNLGKNKFAGTDRCKNDSTECEPLWGFGLRRGGYQCRCKPGYRLPFIVRKPYLGDVVERASQEEYERAFSCEKIGYIMVMPQEWGKIDVPTRRKYLGQYNYEEFPLDNSSNHMARTNVNDFIMKYFKSNTTYKSCSGDRKNLEFLGDVSFGVESQFENEARSAVRLAGFLSSYLQIVDPTEQFGELRVADKALSEDQVFGEAISNVMGNVRIWGTGIYWDRNKFPNRTLFGPFAYKREVNTRRFFAEDRARRKKHLYTNERWFVMMQNRWSTSTDDLREFILKIKIRGNTTGDYLTKYDHYPVRYKMADMNHGHWTAPYFECDYLKKWVVTYVAPFFGWDSLRNKLEFKGVVAVTSILEKLDINQCSDTFTTPNAFKGTHKCDQRSSLCLPMLGRGFDVGGYKCECEQGYEYPFDNPFTYFDGQLLESEFNHMVLNNKSRFDMLKCRIASATSVQSSLILLLALSIISLLALNLNS